MAEVSALRVCPWEGVPVMRRVPVGIELTEPFDERRMTPSVEVKLISPSMIEDEVSSKSRAIVSVTPSLILKLRIKISPVLSDRGDADD